MTLARGYTGLINMNARLYDPVLGRFMTADPTIPNVYNPQRLNRYSYVLNNPFRYTDPTGYSFEPVGGGLQYDSETGIALLDDTYYFPDGSSVNAGGDWTFYDPANDALIDIPNSPDYTGVGEDFFIANDAFSGMSPFSGGLGAEASGGFEQAVGAKRVDQATRYGESLPYVAAAQGNIYIGQNAILSAQFADCLTCHGGIGSEFNGAFYTDNQQQAVAVGVIDFAMTIPASGSITAFSTSYRAIEWSVSAINSGRGVGNSLVVLSNDVRARVFPIISTPAFQQGTIDFATSMIPGVPAMSAAGIAGLSIGLTSNPQEIFR